VNELVGMVDSVLHKVESRTHLVHQRHVQDASANESAKKHRCIGKLDDVLVVLTVVDYFEVNHHDQRKLKQEG
jgi:hypothetical protein